MAHKKVSTDKQKSTKPRQPARKRSSQRDSRKEMIDVAIQIIQHHGVDALRIEDVCEQVGVSKGSLYWHFGDRAGLIRDALLEQMYRMGKEQLLVLDDAVETFTTRDVYLTKVGRALVDPFDPEQVENRWQRLELIAGSRRDPLLNSIISEIQIRHLHFLEAIMTKAAQQGALRPDVDPKAVAAMLVVVGMGSNMLSLFREDGPSQEQWLGLLLVMIDALFPHPSTR